MPVKSAESGSKASVMPSARSTPSSLMSQRPVKLGMAVCTGVSSAFASTAESISPLREAASASRLEPSSGSRAAKA